MRTAWGYDVDASSLPPLLSVAEFKTMTGGRYDDDRAELAIGAASAAIRNACGWHISPSLGCTAVLTAEGKLARVPAAYVSEISKVEERGKTRTWVELMVPGEAEWSHNGIIRRCCFKAFPSGLDAVRIAYIAGFDIDAVPDLAQAVMGIAEGVLALPAGVTSESAGGVSVSYASSASSIAGALTSGLMAQLAPYKVVGSHAA